MQGKAVWGRQTERSGEAKHPRPWHRLLCLPNLLLGLPSARISPASLLLRAQFTARDLGRGGNLRVISVESLRIRRRCSCTDAPPPARVAPC